MKDFGSNFGNFGSGSGGFKPELPGPLPQAGPKERPEPSESAIGLKVPEGIKIQQASPKEPPPPLPSPSAQPAAPKPKPKPKSRPKPKAKKKPRPKPRRKAKPARRRKRRRT